MKKFLALTLALVLMLPLASCKKKNKNPTPQQNQTPTPEPAVEPLFNLDLSEYISIDEKYYKNYTVEVKINKVTEEDIDSVVNEILVSNKTLIESENVIIEEGHVVSINYKGYYYGPSGDAVYFDGGSNIGGTPYDLLIGSGAFIPGFEEGMVGKNPADYTNDTPLVVETRFPDNYHAADLAGKTAYFEVFVAKKDGKYLIYEVPELTDTYLRETLKFTDDILAEYNGDTLTEKYRSYIREVLEWYGVDVSTPVFKVLNSLLWDGAVIKKYPEKHLNAEYEEIVKEISSDYEKYPTISNTYKSLDEYACGKFGLPAGSDWKSAAMDEAKSEIKRQLIIYHIMDVEGLKPTDSEYAELLDTYITNVLANEGITADEYASVEEYNIKKEHKKAWYAANYGEHYLKAVIYEKVWLEAIIDYANLVKTTE